MELVVIISPSCCLELATPLNQLKGRGGRAEEHRVQVGVCFCVFRVLQVRQGVTTQSSTRAGLLGASQPACASSGTLAKNTGNTEICPRLMAWGLSRGAGGALGVQLRFGNRVLIWEPNRVTWRLPAVSLRCLLHPGKLSICKWLWIHLGNEIQDIPMLR